MSRYGYSLAFVAFHRFMRANIFMSSNILDMQPIPASINAFSKNFWAFFLDVLFKLVKLKLVLRTTINAFKCSVLHDLLRQEMNIFRLTKLFPTPVATIYTLVLQTKPTSKSSASQTLTCIVSIIRTAYTRQWFESWIRPCVKFKQIRVEIF